MGFYLPCEVHDGLLKRIVLAAVCESPLLETRIQMALLLLVPSLSLGPFEENFSWQLPYVGPGFSGSVLNRNRKINVP